MSDMQIFIIQYATGWGNWINWIGVFSFFYWVAAETDEQRNSLKKKVASGIFFLSTMPFIVGFLLFLVAINKNLSFQLPVDWMWYPILFFVSFFIGFASLRFGAPARDLIRDKFRKTSALQRNTRTDARYMENHVPEKALEFNPEEYFDPAKGIFVGMETDLVGNGKPVYVENTQGLSFPHIQVCGTTGFGKGVQLCGLAAQFLKMGEAVFFIDPKFDEWAPMVLFDMAKKMNVPYHFINLNRPNGPQFNLFEDVREEEAFELFLAGFALSDRGSSADFYGIADRMQAETTAALVAEKKLNLAQAYQARADEFNDPEFEDGVKFAGRLREMSRVPSINSLPGRGVDLEKIINQGGIVYIVGSMRNDIIKTIQRMLLVRLIQLAERRDRVDGKGLRRMAIVLDEAKYHLSRPALEALGAARDKGVHLVLSHQSRGDLRDCPADLNPDAVVDAVVENCSLKFSYAVQSHETAEWLAALSRTILVDDETRTVKLNSAAAEIVDPTRTIRQGERFFIDSNMILSLQKSCAVFFETGKLARILSIQLIRAPKTKEAVTAKTVDGTKPINPLDALNLNTSPSPAVSEAVATQSSALPIKKPTTDGELSKDYDPFDPLAEF